VPRRSAKEIWPDAGIALGPKQDYPIHEASDRLQARILPPTREYPTE
jgi:hypothetical protein